MKHYLNESMSSVIRCYVASPLGFSESGREFYYKKLLPSLAKSGITILDPWHLTPLPIVDRTRSLPYGPEKVASWKRVNRLIGKNNANAIAKCDVLVAVLDGSDVDSGTAAEIGYAAALGKRIYGYRSDFRLAGDNEGALVNLQVEFFIKMTGGRIYSSAQAVCGALKRWRQSTPQRVV